ncbi:hypothetical protein BHM03_00000809 [Ensete ventricosum]|nr:hypothetical protein BHM03_00000809 [Ensete ventricosum]
MFIIIFSVTSVLFEPPEVLNLFDLIMQPGYSLRTFTGHSASVMSLDFHPNKDDLICSCDGDGEIRYWSIKNGSCVRVFKSGQSKNSSFRFSSPAVATTSSALLLSCSLEDEFSERLLRMPLVVVILMNSEFSEWIPPAVSISRLNSEFSEWIPP